MMHFDPSLIQAVLQNTISDLHTITTYKQYQYLR